jgi:hypothetical protein
MKKWLIYYAATFVPVVSVAVAFKEHTDVHSFWPFIPLFFMGLSFFLSIYRYREDVKQHIDTDTFPKRELNYEEQYELSMCQHVVYALSIPLYLPILFFVPSVFKFSCVVLFIITVISGPAYFRIKHGKKVKERIAKEQEELKVQKTREELGKS